MVGYPVVKAFERHAEGPDPIPQMCEENHLWYPRRVTAGILLKIA